MAEFQELAKAINDNSRCLVRAARGVGGRSRAVVGCAGRIVAEVGGLGMGEAEGEGRGIGFGQLKVFDGSPELYGGWVGDVEGAAFLGRAGGRRGRLLACRFGAGLVSDCVGGCLGSGGHGGWDRLGAGLAGGFSPVLDGPRAFGLLVGLGRDKDEDVRFFAEGLLGAARRACPQRGDHVRPIVESRLLGVFLAGMWGGGIGAQVEGGGPGAFDGACALALGGAAGFSRVCGPEGAGQACT